MVWTSALQLGVPAIDDDHRQLATVLERMEEAMRADKPETAARLLGRFVQAMDRHFDREEMLIAEPQVSARRRSEYARARAVLCDHPDAGDPELLRQLVDYAHAWYVDHVVRQDLPLRRLYVEHGLARPERRGRRLDFLKVKWRIALVALVPLLALAGAVAFAVAELGRSAEQMALLRDLNDLNAQVGVAVHELQREGGLSALVVGGSRIGRAELDEQIQRTDLALDSLYAAMAKVSPRINLATRDLMEDVMAALSLVPEVRGDVERESFDAVTTIDIYTTATEELTRLVPEVVRTSIGSDISRNAVAYVFLLETKERAGRERAAGAAALAPGDLYTLQQTVDRLDAEQVALENGFSSLASRELVEAWRRAVNGPRSNAFMALRRQMRESGTRPNPEQWFEAASLRIDAMRQVEVMLVDRLAGEASSLERLALDRASYLGAGMVALLCVSVLMVGVLGWSILPQLRGLVGALRRLAEGERAGVHIPGLASRDELGDVARTIQQLRERLVLSDLLGARKWTESADRLRVVTDNVPGVVFRVVEPFGTQAQVAYVSRKLREMSGVSPEAVTGRPLHRLLRMLVPPGDREVLLRTLDHSARLGRPIDLETRVNAGPRQRWFRIVASPSRSDEGTAWDGIALDITALRQAEEEKGRATAQLSHMYRLKATAEMAGAIGHEVNDVLQPILASSELALAGTPAASAAYPHLQNVIRGVNQARRLVDRVLSIGGQGQAREPIDLAAVVRDSVDLIRPLLPDKVALETDLDSADTRVVATANEIHQVVSNLCASAVPVLGRGGGTLVVATTRLASVARERAGTWLRLSVRAGGNGLDERRLSQAFAPLFSANADALTLGVGLSVVRSIVDEAGGWVEVASESGLGTAVHVFFPVSEQRPENVVNFAAAASSRGNPP